MVLDRLAKASLPLGLQRRTGRKDYCQFASVFPATKPGVRSAVLLIRRRSPAWKGRTRAILRSALSCPCVLQNKARISTQTLIGRAGGGGAGRWKPWGTSAPGREKDLGQRGTLESSEIVRSRPWSPQRLRVPSQTVWLTAVMTGTLRKCGNWGTFSQETQTWLEWKIRLITEEKFLIVSFFGNACTLICSKWCFIPPGGS